MSDAEFEQLEAEAERLWKEHSIIADGIYKQTLNAWSEAYSKIDREKLRREIKAEMSKERVA